MTIIDTSVSPDDFDKDKNFLRILFNPLDNAGTSLLEVTNELLSNTPASADTGNVLEPLFTETTARVKKFDLFLRFKGI